jgi:hypothetical protein
MCVALCSGAIALRQHPGHCWGAFGICVGGIAAYAGTGLAGLMRFTDLVQRFPPIILAMAIAAALSIGTVTVIAMSSCGGSSRAWHADSCWCSAARSVESRA